MILLVGLIGGLIFGLALALLQKRSWQLPALRSIWLVILAFLPQMVAFYIPATRREIPDLIAATCLILSQVFLLVFCWLNRRVAGMWLLALGLGLNLLVIALNGGFMPISPQTASRLIPEAVLAKQQIGSRFGWGKDLLLLPERTRLLGLSDRFLPPIWFPYQVAFSFGDILVALGAFWLMLTQGEPFRLAKNKLLKDIR